VKRTQIGKLPFTPHGRLKSPRIYLQAMINFDTEVRMLHLFSEEQVVNVFYLMEKVGV